ncbi:predicted protein [Histoplasma capsulatum var. duboisii H88]|uniref:Predicted protein n=2 Tax=Ajellomyces capsulatus TaxID=5037 RepID=F0URB7_AJEC8|nr:predicted protein [Histoplasma capsulatum H143]EGC48444.1 predicted protein [Histoplasma capsulatum var. duboisii H88]
MCNKFAGGANFTWLLVFPDVGQRGTVDCDQQYNRLILDKIYPEARHVMAGNLDIALKSSRLHSCKPNAVNLTKQSDIKNYNRFQENQRMISGFYGQEDDGLKRPLESMNVRPDRESHAKQVERSVEDPAGGYWHLDFLDVIWIMLMATEYAGCLGYMAYQMLHYWPGASSDHNAKFLM